MKKKIISVIFASMLALSATTSAFAEIVPSAEPIATVDIKGYSCYERDGHYWTILDGEEYLVIDVGDIEDYVTNPNEINIYSQTSTTAIDELPPFWTNSSIVNVPHGFEHTEVADLSNGDYCSPIFQISPVANDNSVRYRLKCYFTLNTDVKVETYLFNSLVGKWDLYSTDVFTFNALINYHIVWAGSASLYMNGVALRFLQNGSNTGISPFRYTFQAKLPLI